MRWSPWRAILRRAALRHGFLDPFLLIARLQRFAQPAEINEPIELLRAGAAMHARGLINSRVIQNNLDWVWPYWVRRQFDPRDPAFVPRAFSLTHINLTHRSWTAIGMPDLAELPLVDPRGLVTPFLDGWSLDGWVVADDGCSRLLPSAATADAVMQEIDYDGGLAIITRTAAAGLRLSVRAHVDADGNGAVCRIEYRAEAPAAASLVIALRPFNPDGVSTLTHIALAADRSSWAIDGATDVIRFTAAADRHLVSHYRAGDVCTHGSGALEADSSVCEVGMATAAAFFSLTPGQARAVTVEIPLAAAPPGPPDARERWDQALTGLSPLQVPDRQVQRLYDIATRVLVLLSPGEIFPGPSTYRRFWFRDAAFMLHALLNIGLDTRARRALDRFAERQKLSGYFHSQDGEWDSNGQALWIYARYCSLTGTSPPAQWRQPVLSGARWIVRKRGADDGSAHGGLLPAGFSAEHFGPNDYYYWDDFWGVAGLRSAASLAARYGDTDEALQFSSAAAQLMHAIGASLATIRAQRGGQVAMPVSPYRRLDVAAVGSLVAGYPLRLFAVDDERLLATADFLLAHCLVDGGLFHEIVHSGINAYITLHLAQVLLRAGDPRAGELMMHVARLASPTGQWPEAIHPHTGGGCMGDGQHGWAAAEWVMMVRNSLVCEEGDSLVLGRGLLPSWLTAEGATRCGPTPTEFGPLELTFARGRAALEVSWRAQWRRPPRSIEIRVPGFERASLAADAGSARVARRA